MQPNHSFHQVVLRNTPHLCILHDNLDKKVLISSFITAVEINVALFSTTVNARTNEQNNTQINKQSGIFIHLHTPADTYEPCIMFG